MTGYCIHLFNGDSWLNSNLLVKFRTEDKNEIAKNINSLIEAVDKNEFGKLAGYLVNSEKANEFSDFINYDVRKK